MTGDDVLAAEFVDSGSGESREGLQDMSTAECHALLKLSPLGRAAVMHEGFPIVLPVNYVIQDELIVFRARSGGILDASRGSALIAFEIDGFDAASKTGWSVIVRGTSETVTDAREVERLRESRLAPWPSGDRPNYIRVQPQEISGRRVDTSLLPSHWFG